jgi:hypothetical protein
VAGAVAWLMVGKTPAAPVMGWLRDTSFGSGATVSLTNAGTASPILGNNSANNADNAAIYAGFAPTTLANGQRLTLTASAQLLGTSSTPDFRWGLFKDDGAGAATGGWLGFMGSAESVVWSKDPMGLTFSTTTFASAANGRGAVLGFTSEPNGVSFGPGNYSLAMTIERFNNEIDVHVSLTNALTGYTIVSPAFTEVNPTRLTYAFDRVGFLAGGSLDADQIRFMNVDVSLSTIERPKLQVHSSGLVVMTNHSAAAELVQYEITSNAGSLDSDNWTSFDSGENNDPFGSGWDEVGESDSHLLAELNLRESMVLSTGEGVSLGQAFQSGSTKDLAFRFTSVDDQIQRGVVEYLQSGDYNRDGAVDAADYVAWRKIVGSSVPPGAAADGDGSGEIDAEDFAVFARSFDEVAEMAAIAGEPLSVPEPASHWSLFIVLIYLPQHSPRRKRRSRR